MEKIIQTIVAIIIFFLIYTFLRVIFSWIFSFSCVVLIWLLIVLVICIYGIHKIFKSYKILRYSVKWPKTIGYIKSSYIEETVDDTYEAKVLYKYVVNGKEYMGNIITPGYAGSGKNKAENLANEFSEGKQVIIYYNSTNPKEALLIPGTSPIFLLIILIPLSLIVVTIYVIIFQPEMI